MNEGTAAAVAKASSRSGIDILTYSPPVKRNEPITGLGTVIRAKAPVRISFAGGGTDFPHWFNVRPGAVLCTTINHYARVTLYPREDEAVRIRSVDLGYMVDYKLGDQPVFDDALGLAKATINRLRGRSGMDLDIRCDAPSGSGLGGSSALTAAVIGAVAAHEGRLLSNYELSEMNCLVEREDVKIPGGMQDQYATTFGGFNVIEFAQGRILVNPLRIDPSILNDLEAHLLLCYTGQVRANLGLIDDQIRFYHERRKATLDGMQRIYELVYEMKEALLRARLDTFGELLHEGFTNKKRMNPEIMEGTNAEALYKEALRQGAIGGKLMGAGGGGYLLLYCHTHRQQQVRKALEAMGGQFTNFSFDHEGLQVWRTHCE